MALLVQKYGGTSVGSPERITQVARKIAQAYAQGHQLVVVVSAVGETTDELIRLAYQVADHPSHREMDMLLSAGERISMALLSMALAACQVPACSFTGSQSGIITDQSHQRARILRILGDRIRLALTENKVVIVAGFQGVSEQKEITTLGRGGSDTTAVALAAALRAQVCEIYTDVEGVFSGDPRWVGAAQKIAALPVDLMIEMATLGAGVLHPRSVEMAKRFQVPLHVRSSLSAGPGTEILFESVRDWVLQGRSGQEGGGCGGMESGFEARKAGLMSSERSWEMGAAGTSSSSGMEDWQVTAVTADASKMFLKVTLARPTALAALWERAGRSHLSLIALSFADGVVRFFSEREAEGEWRQHLSELVREGFVTEYLIELGLVPLSVLGHRLSQDGRALAELMETLAGAHINVTSGVASPLAMTVGVAASQAEAGVQALHQAWLERQGAAS